MFHLANICVCVRARVGLASCVCVYTCGFKIGKQITFTGPVCLSEERYTGKRKQITSCKVDLSNNSYNLPDENLPPVHHMDFQNCRLNFEKV